MDKQAYIFIGRSGCGKGTQAELFIEYLKKNSSKNVFYLQTGDEFRKFIKQENLSSKLAAEISPQGKLQPMFLTVMLWAKALVENLKGDEHLVFDGTPRKKDEADVLESVFDFYGYKKPVVIYINVPREWATEKLLARGRGDDELEKINRRQDWFDTEVMVTLDFYKKSDKHFFIEVNGNQSIEEVHAEVINKIGDFEF
ncbi:MAG: nucleoside monophosphate kinase [Patescibacteria group bacterium]